MSAAIPPETLAEDQDLTIAVQRAGWRVAYDQSAIAWTEAPQIVPPARPPALPLGVRHDPVRLEAQAALSLPAGRAGLAFVGLPQTILFQLLFALVSPIIDLALIVNIVSTVTSIHEHGYTAVKGDLQHVALFWLLFAAIDLTAGLIAIALERRENWRLIGLADPAALRLSPDHVLCRHQGRHPGAAGPTGGLVDRCKIGRGPRRDTQTQSAVTCLMRPMEKR